MTDGYFAPKILGIDIGARQIGVCVLKGEELVFYAVKSIRQDSASDTLKRLRKVLTALIEKYDIEFVAVEKVVYVQQQKSFVKTVCREAKRIISGKRIKLYEYSPQLIRCIIGGREKPTKRNTALMIARKYNELTYYFNVPKLWQRRYFAPLFDAIAVGLVCAGELMEAKMPSVQLPNNKKKGKENEFEY